MTKEIKLENGNIIVVKPLALRKYAQLLDILDAIPKQINTFDKLTTEEIIPSIPGIVKSCFSEILKVIEIATDLPNNEVDELTLLDATNIFVGVLEVNNYDQVFQNIKKVIAPAKKMTS